MVLPELRHFKQFNQSLQHQNQQQLFHQTQKFRLMQLFHQQQQVQQLFRKTTQTQQRIKQQRIKQQRIKQQRIKVATDEGSAIYAR